MKNSHPHIGIFGRRNNGKSALINAILGQEVAIVSEIAGTTTDPVKKSIEISGLGPVVLIDTAGIDDEGELGKKRIEKTENVVKQIDLAILVLTHYHFDELEKRLIRKLRGLDTPFIILNNKSDITTLKDVVFEGETAISVSAKTGYGITSLIERMKQKIADTSSGTPSLLEGVVKENDTVLLITPIDSGAPEGRLILPQVQTIRAILDLSAVAIVLKEDKVADFFTPPQSDDSGVCRGTKSNRPNLVITDSQIFKKIAPLVPSDVPFTSFSILLARFKGDYENYLKGTPQINHLKEGDSVLILESCTHLSSCEDIGRVKIPQMLSEYTGKRLHFDFVSGLASIPTIEKYALVVQCGGCMITKKQLANRLKAAVDAEIPVTNYGMLIAFITGIFERTTRALDALYRT